MSTAPHVFNRHAAEYDALRRRLVPQFDTLYTRAIEALTLVSGPVRRVLDLGAGTGLLSARVAAAYSGSELVLVDAAPAMLEVARARLSDRPRLLVADLRDPLPPGPFDAVVSALAIHHLEDADKQDLFSRIRHELRRGGVFVNLEQVAAPTAWLAEVDRLWHQASAAALGATPDEWAAAQERMSMDRCATVEDQLAWLTQAGFVDAGCLFKDHLMAVLIARRW